MSEKNILKKGISVWVTVILILLSVLLTFQITYLALNNKYNKLLDTAMLDTNSFAKLAEVDELYRTYYINEIDENTLNDYIIQGYVIGTGDKYASYMNAAEFEEYMNDINGSLVGIGVLVIYNPDYYAIEIVGVMPDSPALKAGLMPGDLIIAVNGKDVSELGYYGAVAEVRGEIGTELTVQIARLKGSDYEKLDFTLQRDNVTEETVVYRMYDGVDSAVRIGIVEILSFDRVTPVQFQAAVADLLHQGAEAFLFDVRYNPGGDLDAICSILDMLLPEGPIVRITYKDGTGEVISSDAACLNMPLAVLINENTCSAAELFSSAIQDYKLGKLVGVTTYGKGTMQQLVRLADNSALSISIAKYNPPYSENYEGIGVKPDVEVEMAEELRDLNRFKITDEEDTQLQAAVDVLNNRG